MDHTYKCKSKEEQYEMFRIISNMNKFKFYYTEEYGPSDEWCVDINNTDVHKTYETYPHILIESCFDGEPYIQCMMNILHDEIVLTKGEFLRKIGYSIGMTPKMFLKHSLI